METRWNNVYRRINIHSKQQEAQKENTTRKPQLSRCGTFRTAKNNGVAQTKLLVARLKGRCQEIHTRMF